MKIEQSATLIQNGLGRNGGMKILILTVLGIAWPLLVIWAAIKIGHSLEIIDSAKVVVRDKAACEALQVSFDKSCQVEGRMEGRLDGTWWLQPKDAGAIFLHLPADAFPFYSRYDPKDYHIRGGMPSAIVLVTLTVILSLLGPVLSWRSRRKLAKCKKTLRAVNAD